MGGSAVVFYGSVSDSATRPRPKPRSLVDRMFGRTRVDEPTWSQMGSNLRMIDLPAAELQGLGERFVEYVERRLDPPWPATTAALEYLRLGVLTTQICGAASGDKPAEWYLQLTFSGCAGMAEVSSELAAHWAELWFRAERADLESKFLKPYGFTPDGRIEPDRTEVIFVPFGVAGYAIFNGAAEPVDEDDHVRSRYFDLDVSAVETLDEDKTESIFERLDREGPGLLTAGGCCCQMCTPSFDRRGIERVIPFPATDKGQ